MKENKETNFMKVFKNLDTMDFYWYWNDGYIRGEHHYLMIASDFTLRHFCYEDTPSQLILAEDKYQLPSKWSQFFSARYLKGEVERSLALTSEIIQKYLGTPKEVIEEIVDRGTALGEFISLQYPQGTIIITRRSGVLQVFPVNMKKDFPEAEILNDLKNLKCWKR